MLGPLGIKSVLDLGCGRGISTGYFLHHGADVLCIEGSHDAVIDSFLPPKHIVEHDFTRGPWWPSQTWDATWCVEFLEHVGRQYFRNYLPVLKSSALIFVTYAAFGGYHHVEMRESWWWISRFEAAGFVYSPILTNRTRMYAQQNGDHGKAEWIKTTMTVFLNPKVASLTQHDHLFSGHGCVWGSETNVPCNTKVSTIAPLTWNILFIQPLPHSLRHLYRMPIFHAISKIPLIRPYIHYFILQYKWYSPIDNIPPKYLSLLDCEERNFVLKGCRQNPNAERANLSVLEPTIARIH